MNPSVEQVIGDDALESAVRADVEWIWVLAGGGRPRPDALERLLDAALADPACVVAAGLVADSAGRPIELLIPAGTEADSEGVIRLAQRNLLPIRNATFAHTLVRREALVQHGLPNHDRYGQFAATEWTARVLRGETANGVFAPLSVVVREPPEHRPREVAAVIRTARTTTWTRGETARQLWALLRRQ